MTTTIYRDPGESWAAAGRGIAGGLGALLSGESVRQRAEQDTAAKLADTYYRNMAGNKYGAEAEGLSMTNTARKAPIDSNLPAYLQTAFKAFQATGDNNMERFANAGTEIQTQGIRDQAVANVDNLDMANRLNTLAKPGQTYTPWAKADHGAAINQATGEGVIYDAVLREMFGDKNAAEVLRDKGAANSSNAAAGKYGAETRQTNLETGILEKTGAKPGAGREASEGALSSTIIRSMDIPMLDTKGRPVTDAYGKTMMKTDQDALVKFYGWLDAEGRKPTATAFAQWEARGRPAANKSPAPAPGAPKIGAIENGYRFKGGNPASPESWEKMR